MNWKQDKLKPTQPFFVLETTDFKQKIYLEQGISHFYSFKISDAKSLNTVPDGCIDLLFEYSKSEMRAYACGTVLKCGKQFWDKDREIFGVRFLPGYMPAGINVVLKDLINRRLLLDDIIEDRTLIEKMALETDFYQRVRIFIEEYTRFEKRRDPPFGKVELCLEVKDMVYESDGLIRVHELAENTGYTERYINKVFIELMGFSPKVFCKIIQFQRALEFLNYGAPEKMTEAAVELGYYDQPKFIRDFKEFAGITPNKYFKLVKQFGYQQIINGA